MKKAILFTAIIGLAGCASHAGPFVTNISSDGRGGINMEKCMIKYDRVLAVVENANCSTSSLQLSNQSQR